MDIEAALISGSSNRSSHSGLARELPLPIPAPVAIDLKSNPTAGALRLIDIVLVEHAHAV
jgi:hypothetical protein